MPFNLLYSSNIPAPPVIPQPLTAVAFHWCAPSIRHRAPPSGTSSLSSAASHTPRPRAKRTVNSRPAVTDLAWSKPDMGSLQPEALILIARPAGHTCTHLASDTAFILFCSVTSRTAHYYALSSHLLLPTLTPGLSIAQSPLRVNFIPLIHTAQAYTIVKHICTTPQTTFSFPVPFFFLYFFIVYSGAEDCT